MNRFTTTCIALLLTLAVLTPATSQTFSVDAYQRFLDENKDLKHEGLETMHDAGRFAAGASARFGDAQYADSIDRVYTLTSYEKELIDRHGFMVTERLAYPSFGDALHNVFINDLPVFVSTDAILHALHKSYDAILMDIEDDLIIPRLNDLLAGMQARLTPMAATYAGNPQALRALDDVDVYLAVSIRLLNPGSTTGVGPVFGHNRGRVDEVVAMAKAEEPVSAAIFGDHVRNIDFSQLTVRGHYTDRASLSAYFQAMMWLGRTELYLSEIKGVQGGPTPEDVRHQTIVATLLAEAMDAEELRTMHGEIERILRFMIGESDNVTPANIDELLTEVGVANAAAFADDATLASFQNALATKPYAGQRILSQILYGDPMSPDKITPPSAFLLFGQRFVIDSYVTGSVVHDKVYKRMLPSSLDVLFALGNDAALHLLQPEIERYDYAKELAGLRYLIDGYDTDFWRSTMYNGWLGAIRSLNPPADRSELPGFMRTAAWWQQKMNTQLSSWAELRHDNLLYAKQSYTGGIGCSYPKGYVEPIPDFYVAVAEYAERGVEIFGELDLPAAADYFGRLKETAGTLEAIARKELAHEALNEEEIHFIETMLTRSTIGCGEIVYNGWYPSLFYGNRNNVAEQDFLVADVHTSPTDEEGNMVGWVLHVGTGRVDMAVVTCQGPEGETTAYIGPVMSYHEHVTTNFDRLTDERWSESIMETATRPSWTNLYLADRNGGMRGEPISLRTDISGVNDPAPVAGAVATRVFPNPFNGTTTISVVVPPSLAGALGTVAIYDARGARVVELLRRELPAGSYMVQWDGRNAEGTEVAEGVYFYTVTVDDVTSSGSIEMMGR